MVSALLRILLGLSLFGATHSVFAAAWAQPKGNPFLILNSGWYKSCDYWTTSGSLKSGPCYNQYQLNPYFEYGLTPELTLGFSGYFREVSLSNQNTSFEPGDLQLFARYQFWTKGYDAFSVQITGDIPLQNNVSTTNPLPPEVTLGQYWGELRFLYGVGGLLKNVNNSLWYTSFEAGYQQNYNGAADQVNLEIYMGWKSPAQNWQIELKSYNSFTMNNPDGPNYPSYDIVTLQPGIIYWLSNYVGFEVGVYQDLYGTNIGRGTAPFVALWLTKERGLATARG